MTPIDLNPKTKSHSIVTKFKPMNLCNVFYKIIAKVLANQFKAILLYVISPTHSAFVPRRLITDNVIVAFESFHTLKHRMKAKKSYIAVKLDMSKVYNMIEWVF